MSTVFGLFHGGANYSVPSVHDAGDVEPFDGIAEIVRTLADRRAGRDPYYPNVDDTAEFHVWMVHPHTATGGAVEVQEYPDRRVYIGPRGGIRVERV